MTLPQVTDVLARPSREASTRRWRWLRTLADLAIVTAVALALRLPAVNFGLPTMLHSDEPGNIEVGARMAAYGHWNPHYFAYPSLLYDVEALADRVARLVTGHMLLPGSFSTEDMGINRTADPHMVLALRLITVALSVGVCLLCYGAVRRVTARRWLAVGCGLLAATSPLLVTNGVFVTPDTYAAFFTAATLVGALAVLRRGSRCDHVLAGIAVGLTAGSKYDIVAALPVVVAYVLREGRGVSRPRALVPLALAAVAAAAAFALTTPAVLLDTGGMLSGLNTELGHYSTGHPGEQGGAFGFYLSTLVYDQAVLLPGAALAVVAAWYGRFRRETIVVGAFALGYLALIASQAVRFDRNLLSLLPALILLTGFAAAWLAELVTGRWPALVRHGRRPALAVTAGIGVLILIPALIGARAVPRTLDEAPRFQAAAWLEAHVPKGSSVVNENYGPWIDAGLYRVTDVSYVVSVTLPPAPRAVIVTEKGSGRFVDDAAAYPHESRAYQALLTRYRVAARFTDGPWVEVLTPRD